MPRANLYDLRLATMRRLFFKLDRIRHHALRRSYGWTGIEIGCHTINMAQVCKIDNRWLLTAVWSIEHTTPYPLESIPIASPSDEAFGWLASEEICEYGLAPTLELLENLNSLFHGRDCAATLTDGMIAYRELELPSSDSAETKSMVRSEIALETECELEELSTDCWELPSNRPRAETPSFGAVSLKKSTALLLASDLLNAGFECQTLDAVPCAMARATAMVVEDRDVSTLAVDLGYYQATVTLVVAGKPLMSRGLRSFGLIQLLEQIARTFEISMSDAKTLLFQSPSTRNGNPTEKDEFSNPLQQKLNGFFQSLSNEIDKTIHYANRTYRSITPYQLLLMGAGVRISNIDRAIEARIGLPTHTWAIDLSENLFGNQHVATFAIAAGLSMLAWEAM